MTLRIAQTLHQPRTRRVLEIVYEIGPASREEIAQAYGGKVNSIQSSVQALREAGFIKPVNPGKLGYRHTGNCYRYHAVRPLSELKTRSRGEIKKASDAKRRALAPGRNRWLLPPNEREELRAQLAADVEEFKRRGRRVYQAAHGETGERM